ncbi:TonB-dependent receptor [Siphonobacter curvatus]|uniref:TonB-dependent receptor n=1 Tax=Siphonobacter curvatus TaxID=2094562 RepID=A0A2S7INQ0_9BACT|nr:TonB-dependent receptor [Siphonobacter curvatus]PQA59238.1 TonB-dependent receptor [Siphonobacter curvatus]
MRLKRLLFSLLLCLSGTLAFGQHSGSVTGRIEDENGPLPGAAIRLKGTSQGTVTDLSGAFRLTNVPAGPVTLAAGYIGYQTAELTVQATTGEVVIPVIKLTPEGKALSDVVVRGTMAASQIKAMSIKRNSLALMDVMAADAIGKLPDRNAAEAVQRMPGVAVARYHGEADQATVRGVPFSWTSTLLNGTRMPSASVGGSRNAVLDAVPSEIIQYVQVAKALTPDMEGDAIGGSINFVTRVAPEFRKLSVSAAGGYNNFSKDGTYNASITYGDRFMKGKLGVMLTAAIWDRQWGTDEYVVSYNTGLPVPEQRYSLNSLLLKRYMGKRQTYGLNAGLEYRFNEKHRIFGRALHDKFNDIRPVYESYLLFNTNEYQLNYRYSYYQTRIDGGEIGGEHQLASRLKLDWSASNYVSEYYIDTPPTLPKEKRGLPIATFRQKLTQGFGGLASDGKRYLSFDSPNGVGDDPMQILPHLKDPKERVHPTQLTLQQLVIYQLGTKEEDRVAQANVKYDFSSRFSLKVGGKYRHKYKESTQASLVYLPNRALGVPNAAPLVPLSQLERTEFPVRQNFFRNLNADYGSYAINSLTKNQLFDLFSTQFQQTNQFRDVTPVSNATGHFDGTEDVLALYVMGEWNVTPKLKLFGGVRNEHTAVELNGSSYKRETITENDQSKSVETVTPTTVKNDYHAFLPMIHLKYTPTSKSVLRAAFTRTFIRPNFTELNPGENINTTTNPLTITRGNIDLKPTFASNFDLMGEYYFDNIGLVTGGLFYKKIKDYSFSNQSIEIYNGAQALVTQPQNLENATLQGLELGMLRRFDFLPGFLSGLGVELNGTAIHSSLRVPRVVNNERQYETTSLPNQSKFLFNSILFYERKGLTIRLAGNFRGRSVETINQQLGPDFYIWTNNNFTLDGSAAYAINAKFRVFVEVNNLTNEPVRMYMGKPERTTSTEWYSQRGQAGIRWDIF